MELKFKQKTVTLRLLLFKLYMPILSGIPLLTIAMLLLFYWLMPLPNITVHQSCSTCRLYYWLITSHCSVPQKIAHFSPCTTGGLHHIFTLEYNHDVINTTHLITTSYCTWIINQKRYTVVTKLWRVLIRGNNYLGRARLSFSIFVPKYFVKKT